MLLPARATSYWAGPKQIVLSLYVSELPVERLGSRRSSFPLSFEDSVPHTPVRLSTPAAYSPAPAAGMLGLLY